MVYIIFCIVSKVNLNEIRLEQDKLDQLYAIKAQ